jgi:hypothetical protein
MVFTCVCECIRLLACACMRVCVCACSRARVCVACVKIHPTLALQLPRCIVLLLLVYPCHSSISDEAWDFPYGGVVVVTWLQEIIMQVMKS